MITAGLHNWLRTCTGSVFAGCTQLIYTQVQGLETLLALLANLASPKAGELYYTDSLLISCIIFKSSTSVLAHPLRYPFSSIFFFTPALIAGFNSDYTGFGLLIYRVIFTPAPPDFGAPYFIQYSVP